MNCSIFIVSYNTRDILARCLEQLLASQHADKHEIIVVDNASSDGSAAMVRDRFPRVRLVALGWNMGFARANNIAFSQSKGDFIILLNPDAFVEHDAIANALQFMLSTPSAAACGGLIMDKDGHAAPSARRFPTLFAKVCRMWGLADRFAGSLLFDAHDYRHASIDAPFPVDWVPGTFTVLRRAALGNGVLFDERFFMYYEETDLCLRLRKQGYQVWFLPTARVSHIGGASAKTVRKHFDASGAQISLWRLRSEYLYFRKNHGLHAVIAHALVETTRHLARMAVNSIRPGDAARDKRADSQHKLRLCLDALSDTRFGSFSPPPPW